MILKFRCGGLLILISLVLISNAFAQSLSVEGEAIIGTPGDSNNLLTFNTERPWTFRQFGTGPSTHLELYSTVGLKNFIFTTTGNVGIDVANPLEKLEVNGNIKVFGNRISFGSQEYFEDGGSATINCNGSLVSTFDGLDDLGSSSFRWNAVYAKNGVITTSDARVKSNIKDIQYGLDAILQLHPVVFTWKDRTEEGPKLGLLAQEVQKHVPEVVMDHQFVRNETTGTAEKVPVQQLGLCYSDLIPVVIKGIQEQQLLIDQLQANLVEKEARLAELESNGQKVVELEHRLAKLEQFLHQSTEGRNTLPKQ